MKRDVIHPACAMARFDVYSPFGQSGRRYRLADTVYFTSDCDAEYVRNSLIDHDGYDPDIRVIRVEN